jgi:hypothetical protein
MKNVLTPALILTFSPGEKEPPWHASVFSTDRPANPAPVLPKTLRTFPLLRGEKAGLREVVKLMWLIFVIA